MHSHQSQIRVRYIETDRMGYLHHGHYAAYLEAARTDWLRDLGIRYIDMEEAGIMLTVVNLEIHYKFPAKYDELLTINTTLKKHSGVTVVFDYEIINSKERVITVATTRLAFIEAKTRKPCRAPDLFMQALQKAV